MKAIKLYTIVDNVIRSFVLLSDATYPKTSDIRQWSEWRDGTSV